MTTTAMETPNLEVQVRRRPLPDRNLMLLIPAFEVVALAFIPFFPEGVASTMMTQLTIALLLILGIIDFLTLKVPNLLVYPSIAFLLAGTALVDASLLDEAALGLLALLGVMFVLAIIGRGSMGMGDVKFAALAGCALGWRVGLVALASGFAVGAVVALVLMVARLKGRKDVVPLTPFLAAGAIFWLAMGVGVLG